MTPRAQLLTLAASATLGAAVAGGLLRRQARAAKVIASPQRDAATAAPPALHAAAAMLALSALSDSGLEHYRGSFHNKTMYLPLAIAALTLGTSIGRALRPLPDDPSAARVDGAALATGIIGTLFHLYNVGKRPGGFSWNNLFYAAPVGAPAALSLAALLRRIAERLRGGQALIGKVPAPRALASLVAIGLIGTSAEAALLHFRGAYHNPAMIVPVTVPPLAAALLARAAARPEPRRHPATRSLLRLLVAVGFIGTGFHAYGISRNMGGWRNWSQNLLNGPPLPAPPAFTALGIAGLAALDLLESAA